MQHEMISLEEKNQLNDADSSSSLEKNKVPSIPFDHWLADPNSLSLSPVRKSLLSCLFLSALFLLLFSNLTTVWYGGRLPENNFGPFCGSRQDGLHMLPLSCCAADTCQGSSLLTDPEECVIPVPGSPTAYDHGDSWLETVAILLCLPSMAGLCLLFFRHLSMCQSCSKKENYEAIEAVTEYEEDEHDRSFIQLSDSDNDSTVSSSAESNSTDSSAISLVYVQVMNEHQTAANEENTQSLRILLRVLFVFVLAAPICALFLVAKQNDILNEADQGLSCSTSECAAALASAMALNECVQQTFSLSSFICPLLSSMLLFASFMIAHQGKREAVSEEKKVCAVCTQYGSSQMELRVV